MAFQGCTQTSSVHCGNSFVQTTRWTWDAPELGWSSVGRSKAVGTYCILGGRPCILLAEKFSEAVLELELGHAEILSPLQICTIPILYATYRAVTAAWPCWENYEVLMPKVS